MDALALTLLTLTVGCVDSGPCARIGRLESCTAACAAAGGGCDVDVGETCVSGVCAVSSPVDLPLSPYRGPSLGACTPAFDEMVLWPHEGRGACRASAALSGDYGYPYGEVIAEDDCDAAYAATGIPCWWSDGTVRTRSPAASHTTCPAPPTPAPLLCGGPCGDCDSRYFHPRFWTEPGTFALHCVGRNDDRDLGVCSFGRCSTAGITACPGDVRLGEEWGDTRCLCLLPSGQESGWTVPESACIAYRDAHPGSFDCRTGAGVLVP